ncbi:hypothetical protein [Sorangium sp. So ce1151]|uniref:hypothetical protein n=1 Tax=Sorangium sp. So ce1151 TaxID=3133332 RepID=UPI003F63ADC8
MSSRRMAKKAAEKTAARTEVVRLRRPEQAPAVALGPGAHFAKLFKRLGEGRYEAHVVGGERVEVGVAPEVDLELADRCLAEQEIVLVGVLGKEVVVFGALRTKERKAEEVVVEAPRKLVLRAGKSKLELSADGKVKLSGNDVTVDAPREVRIASARVEIP